MKKTPAALAPLSLKKLAEFGETAASAIIKKARENCRLHHAYLFTGSASAAKAELARSAAAYFNCQNPTSSGDFCGECLNCQNLAKGVSPLYLEIKNEPSKKSISIVQIRELKRMVYFSPLGDEKRVVVINRAEDLEEPAQNSFLKILEEPSPGTIFILINDNPYLLRETIISRCQKINFNAENLFKKSKIDQNFPSEAEFKDILSDDSRGLLKKIRAVFFGFQKEPLTILLDVAYELSDGRKFGREKLGELLNDLIFMLREKLKYFFQNQQFSSAETLKKRIKMLSQALADLESNANILLTLDFLVLKTGGWL